MTLSLQVIDKLVQINALLKEIPGQDEEEKDIQNLTELFNRVYAGRLERLTPAEREILNLQKTIKAKTMYALAYSQETDVYLDKKRLTQLINALGGVI